MLYTVITQAVETVVLVGDPDYLTEVIAISPKALDRGQILMFENDNNDAT
ncbi:hypothetical protein [Sinorhizobium meliloti]|nr:hypothetical protein [Sinorhizobium meliloti]